MTEIISVIKNAYLLVCGEGLFISIFWASILVLILYKDKTMDKYVLKILAILSLVLFFIVLSPIGVLAFGKISTGDYTSAFYIIPIVPVMAVAGTCFLKSAKNLKAQYGYFAVIMLIIIFSGRLIYMYDHFIDVTDNKYIVDAEVAGICDDIVDDAAQKTVKAKAAASVDIVNYIRKYDASINVLNSFDATKYAAGVEQINQSLQADEFFKALGAEDFNIGAALNIANDAEVNYLILDKHDTGNIDFTEIEEIINQNGFMKLSETVNYNLYTNVQ